MWKKRCALALAGLLVINLLTGCGLHKVQDTQMDAYENGTTRMSLGDVHFEVPSDWKAEETADGRLVAVATDDAGTDVVFTFTYTQPEQPEKNSQLVEDVLGYESAAIGYPASEWVTTPFQGVEDAKTVSCTYVVKEVTYDEQGLAVPIGGTACFIVRKTIIDGLYDAFEDDYQHILNSIELPENASDDSAAGKAYSEIITEDYVLPSGTTLHAALAENDLDDSLTYIYELSGTNGNTLSCDLIFLYSVIMQAGQTDYIITTKFGDLTSTVSTTELSGINTDGTVVEMGYPDWITAEFEQNEETEKDVSAIFEDMTAFVNEVVVLLSGGELGDVDKLDADKAAETGE